MKRTHPLYFTCICLLIFNALTYKVNAQRFFYSDPVGNFSSAGIRIIGHVKNNIIIWHYTLSASFEYKNSELLVYNNQMELLKRVPFIPNKFFLPSIKFVNEANSFSVFLQYKEAGYFNCKMMSFDENANELKTAILEKSPDQKDGNYDIISSAKNKTHALLKLGAVDNNGTLVLHYSFIKNDSVAHSGDVIFPFDVLSSEIAKATLDDNNLLIPITNSTSSLSSVTLYKINLENDSLINSYRNLNAIILVPPSIKINKTDSGYTIVSLGIDKDFYNGDRVFYWNLNSDLTDINSDTVFADNSSCLRNLRYSELNFFAFNNYTSNVVLSSLSGENDYSGGGNYFSRPSYNVNLPQTMGGSFYEGRINSMIPQQNLNGNGYANQSNVQTGPTWYQTNRSYLKNYPKPGKNFKQKNILVFMNIADGNKLKWMQCFNEKIDNEILPTANHYFYINNGNTLHMVYSTLIKKNKYALEDIIISNNGNYTIQPIISTDLRYEYFINQSFQLDKSSILIPCSLRGKIVFSKFTF